MKIKKHSPRKKGHDCTAQMKDACGFLEHWHTAHTDDSITVVHGEQTDVYVVSDRDWKTKLNAFTHPAFHPPTPTAEAVLHEVPAPLIIHQVDAEIHAAGREQYEGFRHETMEALRASGVLDSIMVSISQWALGQPNPMEAGIHALRGGIASGFQLGLLVADRMKNPPEGAVQ